MSIEDNKRVVRSILEDWLAPASIAALGDDLVLEIIANGETFPPAAKTYSKDEVLDVFRRMHERFGGGVTMAPISVVAQDDRVIVEVDTTAVLGSDPGRRFENPAGFAFELENGKVIRIEAFPGDGDYVRQHWAEEFSYIMGTPMGGAA